MHNKTLLDVSSPLLHRPTRQPGRSGASPTLLALPFLAALCLLTPLTLAGAAPEELGSESSTQTRELSKEDQKVAAFLQKADQLARAGKSQKACKAYQQAQDIAGGQSLEAAFGMSQSYLQLGEPRKSREHAEVAMGLATTQPDKHLALILLGSSIYQIARDLQKQPSKKAQTSGEKDRTALLADSLSYFDESLEEMAGNELSLLAASEVSLALDDRKKAAFYFEQLPDKPDPRLAEAIGRIKCLASESVQTVADLEKLAADPATITRPRKLSGAQPGYTTLARQQKWSGQVVVQAVIDEEGNVACTRVLQGAPFGLSGKAVEAVEQWKFEPAKVNGTPYAVHFSSIVTYKIQ